MGIFDDFSVHFRSIIPSISLISQRVGPYHPTGVVDFAQKSAEKWGVFHEKMACVGGVCGGEAGAHTWARSSGLKIFIRL